MHQSFSAEALRNVVRRSLCPHATKPQDAPRPGLSDGAKTLRLLLQQQVWTHRRVETVSFSSNGETRRRISWDFTLPRELAISASQGRVAVPIATLRKETLQRLDVSDAAGEAVPVWNKVDNGELAVEALLSGLQGVQHAKPSPAQISLVERIVLASDGEAAATHIQDLLLTLPGQATDEDQTVEVFSAVAADLAANFLFVVELPEGVIDQRTLLKLAYSRDIGEGEGYRSLSSSHEATVDGESWATARSWHLEVHAPDGLAVSDLSYESWNEENDVVASDNSATTGHTAHITGDGTARGTESQARLVLRPAAAGLVN